MKYLIKLNFDPLSIGFPNRQPCNNFTIKLKIKFRLVYSTEKNNSNSFVISHIGCFFPILEEVLTINEMMYQRIFMLLLSRNDACNARTAELGWCLLTKLTSF